MTQRGVRNLLFISLAFVALAAAAGVLGWALAHRPPVWYRPGAMNPQQREIAAQNATNKFVEAQNAAALANSSTQPIASSPLQLSSQAITITLTDDELNAFAGKWSVFQNLSSTYSTFLIEPRVAFEPGRVILAGRVPAVDAVMSLHFEPRVDPNNGTLEVKLVAVRAGALPVPAGFLEKYEQLASDALERRLPRWRDRANLNPSGGANGAAVSAALARFGIDVLRRRPTPAVVFLPMVERGSVPMNLTDVQVRDHEISLTLVPMSVAQRNLMLKALREDRETASR